MTTLDNIGARKCLESLHDSSELCYGKPEMRDRKADSREEAAAAASEKRESSERSE